MGIKSRGPFLCCDSIYKTSCLTVITEISGRGQLGHAPSPLLFENKKSAPFLLKQCRRV